MSTFAQLNYTMSMFIDYCICIYRNNYVSMYIYIYIYVYRCLIIHAQKSDMHSQFFSGSSAPGRLSPVAGHPQTFDEGSERPLGVPNKHRDRMRSDEIVQIGLFFRKLVAQVTKAGLHINPG